MQKFFLSGGTASLALMATLSVFGPMTSNANAQELTVQPNSNERAIAYLNTKNRELDERERRIRERNPGLEIPEEDAGVFEGISVNDALELSPATRAALRNQFLRSARLDLAMLGYNRGVMRSARGSNIRDAVVRRMRGQADISDMVLLADTVVIGRVVAVEMANPDADGFGGTVTVEVTRAFEGDAGVNEQIFVRLATGQVSETQFRREVNEFIPDIGDNVAVIGSESIYRFENRRGGGRGQRTQTTIAKLTDFYLVDGNRLVSRSADPNLTDTSIDVLSQGAVQ